MARRRAFDMCHPSVNLLYFLLVLVCSVGCMHPACLGISLGGALACGLLFRGRRAVGRLLGLLGPVALLAAGGNLLLVRQGETVLARLPGGRPLTLESALYGLAAACLLGAVIFALVYFSNLYFVRSIVDPVKNITGIARRIRSPISLDGLPLRWLCCSP